MFRFHNALSEVKCPDKVYITHINMAHHDHQIHTPIEDEFLAQSQFNEI